MYEEYFGLKRPPFKITPDTSLFFGGGKRGDILGALVYAIHRGEGIIKVVGEVGSGKTMLCRMLQLKLPETVETVYIANPSVTPEDILFVIANELNLHAAKDASKHEVVHLLQEYLLKRHMENGQVVLFVEEAQGMPIDTLEEIRLLSNLETDQNKLLQIVLFGQPELDENLAQKSIRQLRERITHSFNLSPLTPDEIHDYLNFRMREVGYSGPELINSDIAKKIGQHSNGLLRRINIIADKILLSAYSESTHNLKSRHVVAAVNDSSFNVTPQRNSKLLWWLTLLVLVALAFGAFNSHRLLATGLGQSLFSNTVSSTTSTIQQPAPIEQQTEVEISAIEKKTDEPVAEETVVDEDIEQQVSVASVVVQEITDTQPLDTNKVTADTAAIQDDEKDNSIEVQQEPEIVNIEIEAEVVASVAKVNPTLNYKQWLDAKVQKSREWLVSADGNKVSIQVLVRKKSAGKELVSYLQNEWPLDLSKTYLYEGKLKALRVYRVYYNEFDSVAQGKRVIKRMPESVKVNLPYLNFVHRMQKALL